MGIIGWTRVTFRLFSRSLTQLCADTHLSYCNTSLCIVASQLITHLSYFNTSLCTVASQLIMHLSYCTLLCALLPLS